MGFNVNIYRAWVSTVAIGAVVFLAQTALSRGIDGVVAASAFGAIAGVGGGWLGLGYKVSRRA